MVINKSTFSILAAVAVLSLWLLGIVQSSVSQNQATKNSASHRFQPGSQFSELNQNVPSVPAPEKVLSETLAHSPVKANASVLSELTLIGIVKNGSGDKVVIRQGGSEAIYQIDEEVIDGWRLQAISLNNIELSNGDATETVFLTADSTVTQVAEQSPKYLQTDARKRAALERAASPDFNKKLEEYINGRHPTEVEFPLGVSSYGVNAIGEYEYEMDRNAISEQLLQTRVDRHAKYKVNDTGLEFEEVVPGSLFDKGGLIAGDRIKTVNGQEVKNLQDIVKNFPMLLYGEKVSIVLQRDGEEVTFSYVLN